MQETITCKKHDKTITIADGCPECIEELRKTRSLAKAAKMAGAEVTEKEVTIQAARNPEDVVLCTHGEAADKCHECQVERERGWYNAKKAGLMKDDLTEADKAVLAEVARLQTEERLPVGQRALIAVEPLKDAEVAALVVEAEKILGYATALKVKTLEQSKSAVNDLSIISGIKKRMENKRKDYLGPVNEIKDTLNQQFKDIMSPILEAERLTKDKQMGFLQEQARRQAEQEEINRKRQEAAEAEMKLNGELSESVNLVEVVEAPERIRAELGTTGLTDHWKYEIVDFAVLSDEYKVADGAMLTTIARKHHDQKQVSGIRFYNEPYLATRTRT